MAKRGGTERAFNRILKDKFGGDLSKMQADVKSGAYKIPGRMRDIMGKTVSRQEEQNSPMWNTPEGQALRQLGGGLGQDTLKNLTAFTGLGQAYFPDEMFKPMEQDPQGEGLAGSFGDQFNESRGAVTKGLGSVDTQEGMLTPELRASLDEVAKGAVNDPTLMSEAERSKAFEQDLMGRADKERQIDPIQQAVIDEQMRRSQGYTPEEKAAYLGQMETAIGRNQQAAMRNAAAAGQRGLRGGLASDLNYRANQDALAARAAGGQQMILSGRELGDKALEQAGTVADTAVGQARTGYGQFADLAQKTATNTGTILDKAVAQGLDKYKTNIARSNSAAVNLGNLNTARTGLINAGSGAANAASGFFNPYLANRQNVTSGNKQLEILKGQTRSNFALGGLGFGTQQEKDQRNQEFQDRLLQLQGKIAGYDVPKSPNTNSQKGSDAPLR